MNRYIIWPEYMCMRMQINQLWKPSAHTFNTSQINNEICACTCQLCAHAFNTDLAYSIMNRYNNYVHAHAIKSPSTQIQRIQQYGLDIILCMHMQLNQLQKPSAYAFHLSQIQNIQCKPLKYNSTQLANVDQVMNNTLQKCQVQKLTNKIVIL